MFKVTFIQAIIGNERMNKSLKKEHLYFYWTVHFIMLVRGGGRLQSGAGLRVDTHYSVDAPALLPQLLLLAQGKCKKRQTGEKQKIVMQNKEKGNC